MSFRNVRYALLVIGLAFGLSAGVDQVFGTGGDAEARAGRPLTPVSVAGVGRRTVRRCAAGVYSC